MHNKQQIQDLWAVPLSCHTQFSILTFFLGENSCDSKYFGTCSPQVWVCVTGSLPHTRKNIEGHDLKPYLCDILEYPLNWIPASRNGSIKSSVVPHETLYPLDRHRGSRVLGSAQASL